MDFTPNPDFLEYNTKEKIGNQTLAIDFGGYYNNPPIDTVTWGVTICLYNKRKDKDKNLEEARNTGKGLTALITAKKAIKEFEEFIIEEYPTLKHIIVVHWADNRRRDVYTRTLTRCGYKIGTSSIFGNIKVLYKKLN